MASINTLVLDRGSKKVLIRVVEKVRQKVLAGFGPKTGTMHLHPFKRRVVGKKVFSEPDRREQEFNIMREIQQTSANYNRLIAAGISLGMVIILWFIGAVCFWQAEKGNGNWSYFESL